MEFGKLPDISLVDFSLPQDAPANASVLRKAAPANAWPWYTGATGWSMKEWVGSFYPKGTSSKDYLKAYGEQFNTIELNTTHYRIPDEETIQRWKVQTPPDFRFCPKIPQTISHSRDLGTASSQIAFFAGVIAGLEERLGPSFLQLPPHFSPQHLPLLKRFLEHWPRELPLAVEFRHSAWFSAGARLGAAGDLLQEHGTGAVITDVAGRRDVLHMRLTAPFTMVRFVGNDLHPSDYTRIDAWISRIAQWFEQGLQQVFFFTHEPDNLKAPQLAEHLTGQLLAGKLRWTTRGPKSLSAEPDNGQFRLF